MIHKLCRTNWDAFANVLRNSTISLVVSVADFGSPVWLNSKHVSLVDVQVNEALRKVSGTLKSTPLPWLPVLAILDRQNYEERMLKKI